GTAWYPEGEPAGASLEVYINGFLCARQKLARPVAGCNTGGGRHRGRPMSQVVASLQPPRSVLLATDLSSHCDRALDRAAQLARQWHATLHVVHALPPEARPVAWWSPEGGRPQDEAEHAALVERQIRHD